MAKDNNTDDELFRKMMSDVKPLSDKKSVEKITPVKPLAAKTHHPQTSLTSGNTGFTPREYVPDVTAEESLFFARPGLQHRLLRQFKRGELRPESQLDLHGYTISEAATLLSRFFDDAQNAKQRCVYVIHGKGHRSAESRPALKAHVNQWLRDAPAVLAFSSAQPKDGGMGAVYVLLKRPA